MTYDLVQGGVVVASRDFDGTGAPMLAANKGVWLPRVIEDATFDPVAQVRTGPVATVEAERTVWTYTVRDKTGDEISAMRQAVADAIDAEAERRILLVMPEYAQRNALALGIQLVTTIGPDPTTWSSDDQATYATDMAAFAAINVIRDTSNALIATIPADAAAISAFNPLSGWD